MEWIIIAWLYACGVYSNAALTAVSMEAAGEPWTRRRLLMNATMFPIIVPTIFVKHRLLNLLK